MLKITTFNPYTCRFPASTFLLSKRLLSDGRKEDEKVESKTRQPPDEKVKKANESLNKLLTSMNTNKDVGLKKIELQKPGGARKQKKTKVKTQYDNSSSDDEQKPQNLQDAVKKVANTIDGGRTAAAKEVESELLKKLLNIGDGSSSSLSEIFSNILVDREDKKPMSTFVRRQPVSTDGNISRAERVRQNFDTGRARYNDRAEGLNKRTKDFQRMPREQLRVLQTNISGKSVNLFESEPLGIFKNIEHYKAIDLLPTWNGLDQRELKQTVTHPPTNYFEKMILWTEQGKLWKFPIDNEQGRDDEAKVYFTEHIFLEQHLESWCPTKGPIRHFMELVCVGLSKNHYITAKAKVEHINWFRDYFEQKKDILESVILDSSKSARPQVETLK